MALSGVAPGNCATIATGQVRAADILHHGSLLCKVICSHLNMRNSGIEQLYNFQRIDFFNFLFKIFKYPYLNFLFKFFILNIYKYP